MRRASWRASAHSTMAGDLAAWALPAAQVRCRWTLALFEAARQREGCRGHPVRRALFELDLKTCRTSAAVDQSENLTPRSEHCAQRAAVCRGDEAAHSSNWPLPG